MRLLASISGSIPLWESEESPAPVIALVLGANLGGALSDGLRGMGWMHRVREHQAWSTIVTSNLPFEEWTSVFQSQRPPRSPSFSRKPPLGALLSAEKEEQTGACAVTALAPLRKVRSCTQDGILLGRIDRNREDITMRDHDRNTTTCIEECLRCYQSCFGMAMTHCLETGGKHIEPKHFRLMTACAEICRTAAHFMLMNSEHAKHLCKECAEICDQCAADCEKLGDMKECVEACRHCAKECRKMAS